MPQFDIVLKNYKIKSYRRIALLIILFNASVLLFLLFSGTYVVNAAISLFCLASYCGYRLYVGKKSGSAFFLDEFVFLVLAASWIMLSGYLVSLACLLLGALYHFSLQKLQIVVDSKSIRKTNFPKAEYTWNRFSNVVLRDGLLTLDFSNNRLIQAEVENDDSINEASFNKFVQQQLAKSRSEEILHVN